MWVKTIMPTNHPEEIPSDAARLRFPPGICRAIEHGSEPGHDIATIDILSDGFTFDTSCYRY